MSSISKGYMSIVQVAKYFGVSRRTIERLIADDKLVKIKIGSRSLIAVEVVERYEVLQTRGGR